MFKVIGAILSPFNADKFDAKIWNVPMSDAALSNCLRGGMADDIRHNVLSVGMSRQRVLELLGKPSDIQGNVAKYTLGFCSGLGVDVDYLDLYFDAADKLIRIEIRQY
ncbi:MAG TPA: hypothetical protein VF800_31800 [Telluria sp.]